jgi:hypothetical protein
MADPINSPEPGPIPRNAPRAAPPVVGDTESLVRETWRHYYVAQLAAAQFGPTSLEASIARSHALTSYQELQGSLRNLESYYRRAAQPPDAPTATRPRHLKLVRDDPADSDAYTGNTTES